MFQPFYVSLHADHMQQRGIKQNKFQEWDIYVSLMQFTTI